MAAVPGVARAQGGPYVYVPDTTSNGKVSTIDSSTNAVSGTIPVGSNPLFVAVTGDGSLIFVSNSNTNAAGNSISVIDGATASVIATIPVGVLPEGVAVTSDGKTVYVANNLSGTVTPISVGSGPSGPSFQVGAAIHVGSQPYGVVFTPDGQTAYVANSADGTVTPINVATGAPGAAIAVGTTPLSLAVTPDGKTLYVSNRDSNSVTAINTATNTVVATIPITGNFGVFAIAISPDGKTAYVASNGPSGFVTPINTATNQAGAAFAAGAYPLGLAISPDGSTLYVSSRGNSSVTPIDLATRTMGAAIAVSSPSYIGMCGNGNALLASGLTFAAHSSGALSCTLSSGPSGAPGPVFTGGTLQIAAAGISSALPIALQAQGGAIDTNGNDATFSGAISGPGGLTKTGAGTLTLSGVASYAGPTVVEMGTLRAGWNAFSPNSAYTIAAPATLDLNNFSQTIGSLAGAGAVTLGTATLTAGNDNSNTTFSGVISGAGALVKIGAGALTLSGANSYAGGTTIAAGALGVGSDSALGTGAVTIASGATLQAAANVSLANNFALNGVATIDTQAYAMTLSGALSDGASAGGVTKIGSGTLTLTGANAYSGGTSIAAGTLAVGANTALGTGAATLMSGATLQAATNVSLANNFALNGFGAIDTQANALTLSGVLSDGASAGGFAKIGSGALTLTGANSFSGGVTIASGTLIGSSTSLGAGAIVDNAALVFDQTANGVFAAPISGSGSLSKQGQGALTLSGANSYSGATDIQAGTLIANGALASAGVTVESGATLSGVGTIAHGATIANGAILAPGSGGGVGTLTIGSLTLNPGSILAYALGGPNVVGGSANDLVNVTGNLALAGTLNVTNAGGFGLGAYRIFNYGGALADNGLTIGTLPGGYSGLIQTAIPGQVNLVVNAPGALTQYWDGATINGDGVIHGGSGAWSGSSTNWTAPNGAINATWQSGFGVFAGAAGTVAATAPLAYQALQFSTDGYRVDAAGAGALTPTGIAPIIVDAGVAATISAPIVGSGGVDKKGLGALALTGANAYSGGTAIEAGTLAVGANTALGTGAAALMAGATLQAAANVSLANNFALTGVATIDTQANALTLTGALSDGASAGGFAKIGSGTLTLTGANAYSGGTSIAAGTLAVGANTALGTGAATLMSGATLQAATNVSLANNFALNGFGAIDTQANALTLSGVLSDGASAGGFAKIGSGALTLTGANSFSGGVTIASGTLIGSSTSLGAGAIVDNAALVFDQTANGVFAAPISGSGSLSKQGQGALVLAGNDTYTGATDVQAGTLVLSGAIPKSAVTVESGAALAGRGAVGALAAQAGATIAPGATAPFATLSVANNASFAAGSTFLVNINAAGQTDKLSIGGEAMLSGGTVAIAPAPGAYTPLSRYTILSAAGGVSGAFAGLAAPGNLAQGFAFLSPSLSYDAHDVVLSFAQQTTNFAAAAITPNQAATATAVQALGLGNPLYNAVIDQSLAGARQAFDALSGEIHASAVATGFEDSRLPREAILDRLSQPFAASSAAAPAMVLGYADDPSVGQNPDALRGVSRQPEPPPRPYGVWGQSFGDFGRVKAEGGAASLERSTGGFVLGGDVYAPGFAGGDWRFGAAAGYTFDSLNVPQRASSGSFESAFGGLYAGASFGPWRMRGGALYGLDTIATSRQIVFPGLSESVSANYGGATAQAFGEIGYRIGADGLSGLGRTALEPFVGAAAIHIRQNAFAENGGAGALIGLGRTYDLQTSTLGLRGESAPLGAWPLLAHGLIGWRHAYGDVAPAALMAFQGGTQSFSISAAPIDRDAFVAELGLDYAVAEAVTLGVSYSGQYGRRAQDSAVKSRLEVRF